MITLNDSGAFFWNALLKDTTVDEVVKKVTSEYEVDEEKAKSDVENFVAMLKENNLIEE